MKKSGKNFWWDSPELMNSKVCAYWSSVSLAIASGLCECMLQGNAAVFSPKSHDNSHITDADSTKHSGLIDADNDNKHTLLRDQGGQTGFCFPWIARIVRRVIQHKDAALDLSKYHYPLQLPPY